MKAKEWVKKFESGEELANLLKEYGVETAELVATRTKTSKPETMFPAAEGAVREQRVKFCAICTRVLTLKESMFDSVLATAIPEYDNWVKKAAQKKTEKPKDDVKDYRQKRK